MNNLYFLFRLVPLLRRVRHKEVTKYVQCIRVNVFKYWPNLGGVVHFERNSLVLRRIPAMQVVNISTHILDDGFHYGGLRYTA